MAETKLEFGSPEALAAARAALDELPQDTVEAFAAFWKSHYMSCGHKKLGRMLLGNAPDNGATSQDISELASLVNGK